MLIVELPRQRSQGAQCSSKQNKEIDESLQKWITNSVGADFATTTVQTPEGMCMIIIDLASEGVDVKKIATSYSASAGTGYISFDDVLVPAENILGTIGKGQSLITTRESV